MIGIRAYGGYVPRRRLQRQAIVEANSWFNPGLRGYSKGERSMCNWDEDSLTMAVEAARDCLQSERSADISAIFLASTTLPFTDRQNAGILATALNFSENMMTMDVSSSQRAGTTALINALQLAKGGGCVLYTAAEKRRTKSAGANELLYGDGAAALLLGQGHATSFGQVVAELLGYHQLATDFVDHYRGQNEEFDYNWEERWIRDEGYMKIVPRALAGAFEAAGVAADEIDHFAIPTTIRNVAVNLAKKVGIRGEAVRDNLHMVMGQAGTAHAPVMLVHALQQAEAGQTICVVGWGQGCDVLIFRATDKMSAMADRKGIAGSLARRKEESNYSKFLAFNGLVTQEKGLRGEVDKQTALSTLYRNKQTVLGFVGGRCEKCGTVQFPKSKICVNPNCGAFHTQVDHGFSEIPASVQSWTADNLTYTEDPPQHFGMVIFAEGGRLMADFTDVDVGGVAVGDKMRMVFRVKEVDRQRNFTRYFWKATPTG